MFRLTDADLAGRTLGCGDGPASFNAEATAAGHAVVSCDPVYALTAGDIRRRVEETFEVVVSQVKLHPERFVWDFHRDPDDLARHRLAAMSRVPGRLRTRQGVGPVCRRLAAEAAVRRRRVPPGARLPPPVPVQRASGRVGPRGVGHRVAAGGRRGPHLPARDAGAPPSPHVEPVRSALEAAGYSVEVLDIHVRVPACRGSCRGPDDANPPPVMPPRSNYPASRMPSMLLVLCRDPLEPSAPTGRSRVRSPPSSGWGCRTSSSITTPWSRTMTPLGPCGGCPNKTNPSWRRTGAGWSRPRSTSSSSTPWLPRASDLINNPDQYRHCHHLPESYPVMEGHTPRSVWLTGDLGIDRIMEALAPFGDAPLVLKDFVKCRKHEWAEACFIPRPPTGRPSSVSSGGSSNSRARIWPEAWSSGSSSSSSRSGSTRGAGCR